MNENKFEVGQEVVWVRNGCVLGDKKIVTKIIAKTVKTQKIKIVGCPSSFDSEGWEVSKNMLRDRIVQMTPELRNEIAQSNLSRRLSEYPWKNVGLETLREVVKKMIELGLK